MKHLYLLVWPILYFNSFMANNLKIKVDLQSLDYPSDQVDFIFKTDGIVRTKVVKLDGYVPFVATDIDEDEEDSFKGVMIHSQETKKIL